MRVLVVDDKQLLILGGALRQLVDVCAEHMQDEAALPPRVQLPDGHQEEVAPQELANLVDLFALARQEDGPDPRELLRETARFVAHQAQTVHSAYHHGAECPGGEGITWRECSKHSCSGARALLRELGLAKAHGLQEA